MLRWAREDNQRYTGDADCQAAYGDNEATAMEHLYAPGKILGFVTPMPLHWSSKAEMPIMAVVSTGDFLISLNQYFQPTKWQQSYLYHAGNLKMPIHLLDMNAIVRHCFLVPHESSQTNCYHEIWCKEL
jgi:hypothetical protein